MATATPLFTILLATHRPPVCLPFAIESVLAQTVDSFELFVIGDGAPAETIACAEAFARRDKRVRVFAFPKGERMGEAHWHTALERASGGYVAHIEDDDLWFPNHLEEMTKLLGTVDFGHLMHSYVDPSNGKIMVLWSDIGLASDRQRFLDEPYNRIGFTFVGYRLSAYRQLPEGWAPSAPIGFWPDLWMWRKFFRMSEFRFGTRAVMTAISITSHLRDDDVSQQRSTENRVWFDRTQNPVQRAEIIEAGWRYVVSECIGLAGWALGLDADHRHLQEQYRKLETHYHNLEQHRDDVERQRLDLEGHNRALDQHNRNLEESVRSLKDRQRELERRNQHMGIELVRSGSWLPWADEDPHLAEVSREVLGRLLASTSWRSTRLFRRLAGLCIGRRGAGLRGAGLTDDAIPSSFVERQRLIREIPRSTSWRIALPVRIVGRLLQRSRYREAR